MHTIFSALVVSPSDPRLHGPHANPFVWACLHVPFVSQKYRFAAFHASVVVWDVNVHPPRHAVEVE